MSNRYVEKLKQHRLILVVTPGRSGTKLLAELMSLVPGVCSEHEPAPYVDNVWWKTKQDPTIAKTWLVRYKIPTIVTAIERSKSSVYVETSHVLCKGFFEPLHSLGIDFDIILLSRDFREVAKSLHSLNNIPMRTRAGRRWLLDPSDEANISKLPRPYSQYSDYQLAYWYVLEMSLRQEHYRKLWEKSHNKVVNADMNTLVSFSEFNKMLVELDLPQLLDQEYYKYIETTGIRHNTKTSTKAFMKSKHQVHDIIDIKKQELIVLEAINYPGECSYIR